MQVPLVPTSSALNFFGLAQFSMLDVLRRAQARGACALGLGPSECPYELVASGPHWQLRDYGGDQRSIPLLVIAAPIKRPYIWDLAPSASAIRCCLSQRLHMYLLEWMPPAARSGNVGLDECASAISECVGKIAGRGGKRPFLIGHSLGGTLAAIFAGTAPETISGLILLSAPLCFEPNASRFRDALISLVPSPISDADPFPGSLLSHMSALASPETFTWSRMMDAFLSARDHHAMVTHARVEQWALDEVALPGRLVHQIIEWLYRENRLCRGVLKIKGKPVDPTELRVPTLAVVNSDDAVAPLASIKPFIDAMPTKDVRLIEFPGEVGVCLQHLGILVGREAHAKVWPEITAWMKSHSRTIRDCGDYRLRSSELT